MPSLSDGPLVPRRAVLAGIAGGLSSGCLQRARSVANRRSPQQVSLSIKTVPADTNGTATEIARLLSTRLEAVGVDVEMNVLAADELYREVLINHDFDIYVAQASNLTDPDFLRPLLHSTFTGEAGWQNPFGYSNLTMDELLERQRRSSGPIRRETVFDILRQITRQQPFSVLAVPEHITAVRPDRFTGWWEFDPTEPMSYLTLKAATEEDVLRVTTTDSRITRNFNPLAVEFRNHEAFTDLLYDPLVRAYRGQLYPWLAADWTWDTQRETKATVQLREELTWHDGSQLTADDVAFTYRFLADTTLGEGDRAVPAPRFRGRISLLDDIERVDAETVRFSFGDTTPEVAQRAFTVPILPVTEWKPRATTVEVAGVDINDGITEALVWPNHEPIGSGPFQLDRRVPEETLVLQRFDDHFLSSVSDEADGSSPSNSLDGADGRFVTGAPFETINVRVTSSDETSIELIAAGEADATTTSIGPSSVPRVGRAETLQLQVTPTASFYHLGYNVREEPLGNPRFRRAIASLLDKGQLQQEIFGGYGRPAVAPLAGTKWLPSDLRWNGQDPEVPFAGTDGELDVATARDLFREAGYQYAEDGRLLE